VLKKIFWAVFILMIFSSVCFGEYLIGTKDLNYQFNMNQAMPGEMYLLKDIQGNILEYGAALGLGGIDWKLAYSKKDNLLNNSLFFKGTKSGGFSLFGQPFSCYGFLGYAAMPSAYSLWTSFEASSTNFFVGGGDVEMLKTWGTATAFKSGLKGMMTYRPGATGNDASDIMFLDSLKWYNDLAYNFPLGAINGVVAYDLDIRMATTVPFSLLYNQGPRIGIGANFWSLAYFYPVQEMYLREKYPYQGKRLEAGLKLPLPNAFRFDVGAVLPREGVSNVSVMFSKEMMPGLNASAFWSQNYVDNRVGIQIAFGEDSFDALGRTYLAKETVTNRQSATVQTVTMTDPGVNVPTLDDLVPLLTSPEAASWYGYTKLSYYDAHNGLSGFFNLYTPQEVFSQKKGNCIEVSRLQAYLLSRNGYETKIVEFAARANPHALCLYKDRTTGKWNAIENNVTSNPAPYVYQTNANNVADLLNAIYPGWFSYAVKDNNLAIIQQVDSTTKWYLNDWFEEL
jgi:hypothetical protein